MIIPLTSTYSGNVVRLFTDSGFLSNVYRLVRKLECVNVGEPYNLTNKLIFDSTLANRKYISG